MNPSTLQAEVLVDEFTRGGVCDVVLCPGSRNAPLAFAFHRADRLGRIRLHVRVDERTAGFLAIGLAASGTPVPVVMTSGTAVANLGPAVAEADRSGVPLIVLSANRPYELLGTGANQTIAQVGMFTGAVRASLNLSLAQSDRPDDNAQWRSAVCRALAAARGSRTGQPGPVHFDVPLREPLVPERTPDDAEVPQGRPDGRPWTAVADGRVDAPVAVDLDTRTLVVAGHGARPHPELAALPTVAEPTARRPERPLHPLALPHVRPEQVVVSGRPTLHRSVTRLLADPAVAVIAVDGAERWPDVAGTVGAVGTRPIVSGRPASAWIDRCAAASARAEAAVASALGTHPKPTGLHVAHAVTTALRSGDQLVLGASNPVRDVALAGALPARVTVRSNRGVAGIDGTVSTAVGAALDAERADPAARTLALLGDLTFLHDASGLLIGPAEPRPRNLTIVVANDGGGGIFELLEQGDPQYAGSFERIFGTPHAADVASLCRAFGAAHSLVDLASLADALARPAQGVRVVEVTTDRTGLRELHGAIRAAL